jgi:uncharacterized damage-inducible protein DinB
MTETADALTFRELLGYTDGETRRWEAWLRERPAALDVPMGEGRWKTVGELVFHTFHVERRYAERLLGEPVTPYEAIPHGTLDEIFAVYPEARRRMERFVAQAAAEEWNEQIQFETITAGTLVASKRKVVAHALLHGIRHWAQIATALRQAGYDGQWMHDILASDALD